MLRRLKALGLDVHKVIFEVVEHQSDNDKTLALAAAKSLSSGFQIAIDDFGVNASREDRVKAIRPNILKVDRSLLEFYMDGDEKWLLHSIDVAKNVNAKVLVEGIETEEQFEAMFDLNIDYFQGFHLGEPKHMSEYCKRK
ncbi:EAL domain-containing protein [Veronia nyctiphanis]|nr:EAL domain-containing protein [Veronia nyctiphanis]